jgi:flagella basal body P-ring formation protein FlgA
MRWLALALLLGALVVGVAAAEVAPAGRITIGRAATVEGKTVRLADIAVLEGGAVELADVDLGAAPDPGGSRRLEGLTILRRLREAGLDDATTRYEIPAAVRVARAAQEVSADELRGAVERASPEFLAEGERIRSIDVPGGVRVATGAYELRVQPPGGGRGTQRRVVVDVEQDGAVAGTATARIDVAAVGAVVRVRHPVARGTVLRRDDLDVGEGDLAGLPPSVLRDPRQALGKETRSALPAGAPVTLQALASPLLVRRGDLVTVVVETPGMRLSVPGEALEPGSAGNAIRVRNRTSRQELSGQVVERGMVLVQY